jgi:hypothetical protein
VVTVVPLDQESPGSSPGGATRRPDALVVSGLLRFYARFHTVRHGHECVASASSQGRHWAGTQQVETPLTRWRSLPSAFMTYVPAGPVKGVAQPFIGASCPLHGATAIFQVALTEC